MKTAWTKVEAVELQESGWFAKCNVCSIPGEYVILLQKTRKTNRMHELPKKCLRQNLEDVLSTHNE